ncbi:MBL fold metallo-hydrolase [Nitrospira sp. Nam74]
MLFKQFYLESLGHASYLIGSEETGEALLLDPRRDVAMYLEEARSQGLSLRYTLDTHQHNDYVSGALELSARAGVQVLSGAAAIFQYDTRRLADGERLEMGEVRFEVLHTPGHTPEHVSLLVTDRSRGETPMLLLSGGALLVGDVARPDLLGGRAEAERHAAVLCETLQKHILTLDDYVEVYPTHVSGSLCGGNIASRLATTIGYERCTNKMLAEISSKSEFVERCVDLESLPAVPPYWPRMRQLNQQGPPLLGGLYEPPALSPASFKKACERGGLVLDCRPPEAFGGGHIPGALNAGLTPSFPTWAGTVLPPEQPYLLVMERRDDLWTVCWHLLRIGYELPQGWLAGGMHEWRTAALPLQAIAQWTVWELDAARKRMPEILVLDVRQPQEWRDGHIGGAKYITGAELPRRMHEVPKDQPVAVICGSGYRSSVSASLLAHHGYQNLKNVLGGMAAWRKAGLPTTAPGGNVN